MRIEYIEQIAQDPKAFFLQNEAQRMRIAEKREQIMARRQIAASISATPKSGGEGRSDSKENTVERALCEIADLEDEISGELGRLAERERAAREAVAMFVGDAIKKSVVEMRHFNGMSFEQIAKKMRHSARWARSKHQRALKEMQDAARKFLQDCKSVTE